MRERALSRFASVLWWNGEIRTWPEMTSKHRHQSRNDAHLSDIVQGVSNVIIDAKTKRAQNQIFSYTANIIYSSDRLLILSLSTKHYRRKFNKICYEANLSCSDQTKLILHCAKKCINYLNYNTWYKQASSVIAMQCAKTIRNDR